LPGQAQVVRLSADADAVVFHLPGLRLPDRMQLENAQLAKRLLLEQILAHAMLYLVVVLTPLHLDGGSVSSCRFG
jgi:hypothetical protein